MMSAKIEIYSEINKKNRQKYNGRIKKLIYKSGSLVIFYLS